MKRRNLLASGVSGIGLFLAGCLGGNDEGDDSTDGKDEPLEPTGSNFEELADGVTGATLRTTEGEIEIKLHAERAPRTVGNFAGLAEGELVWTHSGTGKEMVGEPLYDDVLFHRVIDGFMIQTGDPEGTGRGGPGYTFDDEFHDELRHSNEGIVSMANSGPDTNGSQFFITLGATPHLDERHSVFGEVTEGIDVVRDIGGVETDSNDRPVEDVVLESVTVHEE